MEGIAPSMPGWVVKTPAPEATARFPPWPGDSAILSKKQRAPLPAENFHHGLRARLDVQLPVNVVQMAVDGAWRDAELFTDLWRAGRGFLFPGCSVPPFVPFPSEAGGNGNICENHTPAVQRR